MSETRHLYDDFVKSLARTAIICLSFYFGSYTLFLKTPQPAFYRTGLVFTLGFAYEYTNVLLAQDKLYCRRIRAEALTGLVCSIIVVFICFIRIDEHNNIINDVLGWIVFILMTVFLVIAGIETGYCIKSVLDDKGESIITNSM